MLEGPTSTDYADRLLKRDANIRTWTKDFLQSKNFCDFKVIDIILNSLPESCELQLGNSNRGVGGIDGLISTAVGAANKTEAPVLLILGDLSFGYDSNGLWNQYLPSNLKIVVINNGGGNIFRIIDGPKNSGYLEDFFETKNPINISGIATAYGLPYYFSKNEEGLKSGLKNLFAEKECAILEVETDGVYSAEVLRGYFAYLIKNIT